MTHSERTVVYGMKRLIDGNIKHVRKVGEGIVWITGTRNRGRTMSLYETPDGLYIKYMRDFVKVEPNKYMTGYHTVERFVN